MSHVEPSSSPNGARHAVVVVDASVGDAVVTALTESVEVDGAQAVAVETAAEACSVVRERETDCAVAVGPDARAIAAALERETNGQMPVVSVPVDDESAAAFVRCLQRFVEQWRARQELRDGQHCLADALDALDDVFYIYDVDGRLVRWNDRLNEVFGLSDAELGGVTPDAFFLESSHEQIRKAAAAALDGKEVVVEADAETEAGVVRFELTGHPLEDDDGRVVGFSGVARDVTQSRQVRERLARENADLEAFGRVLTHDLRNPLGVATGYLDEYRENHDAPELRRVARALERMDDLIDEVRNSSRRTPLELSTVRLSDVSQAAWEAVETGDALLVVDTDASVEADPRRLQRLLENLFRNSVQHGSTGGRADLDDGDEPSETSLTVRVGDLDAGFVVADDGTGITAENRETVFRTGFTTARDGTGYGLGIVRELAEMHGWWVGVAESTDGARFEIHDVAVHPGVPGVDRPEWGREDARDRLS